MKKALLSTLVIFLVGFISAESMAQEEKALYNDMSVYPISLCQPDVSKEPSGEEWT
jgi:hypothetical protein